MRLHLINMPFGSLTHLSLAPGLFKAQLMEAGMDCRVFNLNLDFARLIGFGSYESIAFFKGIKTQIGEWLFAYNVWEEEFGPSEDEFLRLFEEEIGTIPKVKDQASWLKKIRKEVVPLFLQESMNRLCEFGEPRIVAFSCNFFQTLPSLALGKTLKKHYPHVKLIYGGACFHGEMGAELIQKIPWIDVVSTGEADDVILSLFGKMVQGDYPENLPGILYRVEDGTIKYGPERTPVERSFLDTLPDPDFSDFFLDATRVGLNRDEGWLKRLILPFESSRGCWWGEKVHCTFCGLNGKDLCYRAKSPSRVYDTLKHYTERYPGQTYQASDNNLSQSYFQSLLVKLRDEPIYRDIYYNVSANMTREQIKTLRNAGIKYIQPGIESLSDHLLKLMQKGVSVLQNIFFLKCSREYDLVPYWNNLIRIPGEKKEDYLEMERLIPLILHLRPPYGGAPKIECHRFSPYFEEKNRWTNHLRPQAWYEGLFPPNRVDLSKVAYYFEADWKDTLEEDAYDGVIQATLDWVRIWREEPKLPQLVICPGEYGIDIWDSRTGGGKMWKLNALESLVYQSINDPVYLDEVLERVQKGFSVSQAETEAILKDLVHSGLALESNDKYLRLALQAGTLDPPLEVRYRRFKKL